MTDPAKRPRFLGEVVASASGESHDWHSHGFGQLILALSGSMYVGTANRVHLMSPAMAVWIPPDAEHWMRTSRKNEMLYVDVNRDEAGTLGHSCRVMAMTPLLNALMLATLPAEIARCSDAHAQALHDLLRQEIISARDIPLSLVLPTDRRIRGLAQKALDDPAAIHSAETWLTGAAASRKTIERCFIAETGMTPTRWLRQARILHAVSRLAVGEKVTSVALDLGYDSPSAFSFMFRRDFGMSPSDFSGHGGRRSGPVRRLA
jgi:AraC-like DNA-binding protein